MNNPFFIARYDSLQKWIPDAGHVLLPNTGHGGSHKSEFGTVLLGPWSGVQGSVKTPSWCHRSRGQSGAPDTDLQSMSKAIHGSTHSLAFGVMTPVRESNGHLGRTYQGHLTSRSTLRRGPIMGAPIDWHSSRGSNR